MGTLKLCAGNFSWGQLLTSLEINRVFIFHVNFLGNLCKIHSMSPVVATHVLNHTRQSLTQLVWGFLDAMDIPSTLKTDLHIYANMESRKVHNTPSIQTKCPVRTKRDTWDSTLCSSPCTQRASVLKQQHQQSLLVQSENEPPS